MATKKSAKKTGAKKAGAKKTGAKKAGAKKAGAKKAGAKKAGAKKTGAKKTGTKKAGSARARGVTVEQYLAKLPAPLQRVARRVQEILAEVAPDARSSIKWGQPVFEAGGPLGYLRGSAKHLTLGFWRGADLSDVKGVLQGVGSRMRHLKLRGAEPVGDATIRRFIEQAVELNRQHGDPTRRR